MVLNQLQYMKQKEENIKFAFRDIIGSSSDEKGQTKEPENTKLLILDFKSI